jgi:hypothetical protein
MVWFGSALIFRSCDIAMVAEIGFTVCHLIFPSWYCGCTEVEFLEEIQTEVLRVFLLAIHRHLY